MNHHMAVEHIGVIGGDGHITASTHPVASIRFPFTHLYPIRPRVIRARRSDGGARICLGNHGTHDDANANARRAEPPNKPANKPDDGDCITGK